jgi:hypothetical protein
MWTEFSQPGKTDGPTTTLRAAAVPVALKIGMLELEEEWALNKKS